MKQRTSSGDCALITQLFIVISVRCTQSRRRIKLIVCYSGGRLIKSTLRSCSSSTQQPFRDGIDSERRRCL